MRLVVGDHDFKLEGYLHSFIRLVSVDDVEIQVSMGSQLNHLFNNHITGRILMIQEWPGLVHH